MIDTVFVIVMVIAAVVNLIAAVVHYEENPIEAKVEVCLSLLFLLTAAEL